MDRAERSASITAQPARLTAPAANTCLRLASYGRRFHAGRAKPNFTWRVGQASTQSIHSVHSAGSDVYPRAGLMVPVGQCVAHNPQPLQSGSTWRR